MKAGKYFLKNFKGCKDPQEYISCPQSESSQSRWDLEVPGGSFHSTCEEADGQRGKGLAQGRLAHQGPKGDQNPGVLTHSPGSFHHAHCKESTERKIKTIPDSTTQQPPLLRF